jgi:hypothetical protein
LLGSEGLGDPPTGLEVLWGHRVAPAGVHEPRAGLPPADGVAVRGRHEVVVGTEALDPVADDPVAVVGRLEQCQLNLLAQDGALRRGGDAWQEAGARLRLAGGVGVDLGQVGDSASGVA